MNIISCFDKSTNMVKPWANAGYTCYCVDTQHDKGETREGNIIKVGANMLDWLPPNDVHFAAFFPPCTDVSISGARWFKDKGLGSIVRALELFKRSVDIAEMLNCKYMIENPVSTVSTYWRKPDHSFHPHDYTNYCNEDNYTKKTCLWTGGGFEMPEPSRFMELPSPDNRIHYAQPGAERADFRSQTPMGFAQAVFEANEKR